MFSVSIIKKVLTITDKYQINGKMEVKNHIFS